MQNNDVINLRIISLDMDETLISGRQLYFLNRLFKKYNSQNMNYDCASIYYNLGGIRKGSKQLLQKIHFLINTNKIDQCIIYTSASNKDGFVDFVSRSLEYVSNVPPYTISRIISRENSYIPASDNSTIKELDYIPSFYPYIGSLNKKILLKIFSINNFDDDSKLIIKTKKKDIQIYIKDLENRSNIKLQKFKLDIDDEICLINFDQEYIFINGDTTIFSLDKILHIDDKKHNILPDELIDSNVIGVPPYFYYLDVYHIINKLNDWDENISNDITDFNTLPPNLYRINKSQLQTMTGKVLDYIRNDYLDYGFYNENIRHDDMLFENEIIPKIELFYS